MGPWLCWEKNIGVVASGRGGDLNKQVEVGLTWIRRQVEADSTCCSSTCNWLQTAGEQVEVDDTPAGCGPHRHMLDQKYCFKQEMLQVSDNSVTKEIFLWLDIQCFIKVSVKTFNLKCPNYPENRNLIFSYKFSCWTLKKLNEHVWTVTVNSLLRRQMIENWYVSNNKLCWSKVFLSFRMFLFVIVKWTVFSYL